MLDHLNARDAVTVTRLDRLARSTRDLLNTLAAITGKKAGFKSLGDTWIDTTTSHGRLIPARTRFGHPRLRPPDGALCEDVGDRNKLVTGSKSSAGADEGSLQPTGAVLATRPCVRCPKAPIATTT